MQEGVKPRLRSLMHLVVKGQIIAALFVGTKIPIRSGGEKLGRAKHTQFD